jgi:hypothetical protein
VRFWGKTAREDDDKMQRLAADVAHGQERSSSEGGNNNNV